MYIHIEISLFLSLPLSTYIYIYIICVCYVYIYIYRERERRAVSSPWEPMDLQVRPAGRLDPQPARLLDVRSEAGQRGQPVC